MADFEGQQQDNRIYSPVEGVSIQVGISALGDNSAQFDPVFGSSGSSELVIPTQEFIDAVRGVPGLWANQAIHIRVSQVESDEPEELPDLQFASGRVEVSPSRHATYVDGQPVHLTGREFDIVQFLCARLDVTQTRKDIYEAVWGQSFTRGDRIIDTLIRKIRHKLGPDLEDTYQGAIRTVFGIGYYAVSDLNSEPL